jgi:uncharacterized protein (DUF3084 family)
MPDHQQLLRAELNAAKIKIAKLTDQLKVKQQKIAKFNAEKEKMKDKTYSKFLDESLQLKVEALNTEVNNFKNNSKKNDQEIYLLREEKG